MSKEDSYNSSLNLPLLLRQEHHAAIDEENAIVFHPSTENTVSFFRSCFNGLNAISGVGILSVPYALACGGWLSLALLFAIAGATLYTGILIKKCMENNSNIRTYPDIGELAFGRTGRLIVSVSTYTELYIVSIGFLILEGDNLSNLFPIEEVQIAGLAIGGKQFFVILVALIIWPTVLLDNLSLLSYVSAGGVFASVVIILSIAWAATFDGVGFHEKGTLVNWNGIPTALSLYAFCYCAHPVFPTLYNSMTDKHKFSNVLLICFVLATAGYASMAIIGYLMFGSKVESQVTLNLPLNKVSSKIAIYTTLVNPISKFALMATPITNALKDLQVLLICFVLATAGYASMAIIGYLMFGSKVESQVTLNLPLNKVSSKIAIYTTLVNPISKFALMATPITNALKDLLPRNYKNRLTSILISTVLVISTTIVALAVPFFGYLMSLVGAFLSVTASIVLPCLCYLKISGTYRKLGCETLVIVAIIIAAIAMGIFGTYTSLMEIVHHL